MVAALLDGEEETSSSSGFWSTWGVLIILIVVIVIIIVLWAFSSRRRRKQEKETQDILNAVKPGNKVKTIGGICGIVVAVDPEENTFILETGSEETGKSYMKFDRQAIYQTDAVVEPQPAEGAEGEAAEALGEAEGADQPAGLSEDAPVNSDAGPFEDMGSDKVEEPKPAKNSAKKEEPKGDGDGESEG